VKNMTTSKAKKWVLYDGVFRAAGEGYLGIHYGSHVWDFEAAQDRRKTLSSFVFRSWVEGYTDGAWRRIGQVTVTAEITK